MFGLITLVIIAALILGGFYYWSRKRNRAASTATVPAPPVKRHISLVTEAMAYVGAVLVLAGGGTAIAQRWDDISDWGHVGVFAAAALFFLAIGVLLLRAAEPAVQRLIGVVWLLSSAGVAAAVGLAAYTILDWSGPLTTLSIGLGTAVYSTVLWLVHRGALQHLAVFVALIVSISGVIVTIAGDDAPPLPFALSLWAFGIAWTTAGWFHKAEPLWMAVPLGTALALFAPSIAVVDHGWLYAVGIATAAAVMAVSVPTHNVIFLSLGTVATFGYVTAAVLHYFGDQLGIPAALAITGVLIIVLAVVSARLMRAAHPATPASSEQPDRTPTKTS